VERLEADLLELTDGVDRNLGEIWFAYLEPPITKEELSSEIMRLERRGWVANTTRDHWLITEAGQTALAEAKCWVIAVRSVKRKTFGDNRGWGDCYRITGILIAGSICFCDHYGPSFSIMRDGHECGTGSLSSKAETDGEAGEESVRLEVGSDPIKVGDLLKYRETYVG
jgi:hypothetical protein